MAVMNFGGVNENVVTRDEFTLEKAREVLKDEKIAVIGYGVQGPGQACNLRDNYAALTAAGYNVVGVSKDSVASHRKFTDKFDLPFTLLADTSTQMLQDFGAWGEKKMCGKTCVGTLRKTFIFNEEGILERIIEKVDTKNHTEQILASDK